ncbi:MAG TPA: lipase family protein [Nocardioidaceae bacterium]|nr:lipase family protein [Nocardioidaceae bacterium]
MRLLTTLAVAASLFVVLPATAAPTMPVPEPDLFFRAPADIASYRPGQVIASRPVDAAVFGLPLPVRAWQVKYRTTDSRLRPIATVTTVLVPQAAWQGPGPRPLVSYQTAEDGVAGRCAPSYALRAGFEGGFTGSFTETPIMAAALAKGWVLSVPDYEGPNSEFLVAGTQARGVLDGIRAARRFRPAGISAKAPVGVWGYSGGSLASVTAAQFQPTYAPRLKLTALALGGLLGDVRATIDAFSGSIGGGAIPMGINGFLRAYPRLRLMQYLSPSGQERVRETSRDCLFDAAARYPFLRVADIEATPNALDAPPVARMLRQNSPLHIAGVPRVPVYEYHTVLDEFAPIGPARATLRKFCAQGVRVEYDEKLIGEHLTEIALGMGGALEFLTRRFAGQPARVNCARIPR